MERLDNIYMKKIFFLRQCKHRHLGLFRDKILWWIECANIFMCKMWFADVFISQMSDNFIGVCQLGACLENYVHCMWWAQSLWQYVNAGLLYLYLYQRIWKKSEYDPVIVTPWISSLMKNIRSFDCFNWNLKSQVLPVRALV